MSVFLFIDRRNNLLQPSFPRPFRAARNVPVPHAKLRVLRQEVLLLARKNLLFDTVCTTPQTIRPTNDVLGRAEVQAAADTDLTAVIYPLAYYLYTFCAEFSQSYCSPFRATKEDAGLPLSLFRRIRRFLGPQEASDDNNNNCATPQGYHTHSIPTSQTRSWSSADEDPTQREIVSHWGT